MLWINEWLVWNCGQFIEAAQRSWDSVFDFQLENPFDKVTWLTQFDKANDFIRINERNCIFTVDWSVVMAAIKITFQLRAILWESMNFRWPRGVSLHLAQNKLIHLKATASAFKCFQCIWKCFVGQFVQCWSCLYTFLLFVRMVMWITVRFI